MGTDEATIETLKSQNPPAWAIRAFASEMPQHQVQITKGYWIDKFEVTNQSFQAFVENGGYDKQELWSEEGWAWLSRQDKSKLPDNCVGTDPNLPRVCVTWYEAEAYAHWRGGRLPTEAEWEYAARGPESSIYPWGNEFDPAKANLLDSTAPTSVGSYPGGVSWVGAHDLAGNAMEWVQDWLDVNYYKQESNFVDPSGPSSGRIKIEKGGWWGSNLFVSRSAYRHFEDPPTYQDHHIGFRVVTPP
jgi:formylglycine-generating enzyme required for sulfatase activity